MCFEKYVFPMGEKEEAINKLTIGKLPEFEMQADASGSIT